MRYRQNPLDIVNVLAEAYHLDDYILERIEIFFLTKIGSSGNTKQVKLADDINYDTIMMRSNNDKNSLHVLSH